jgi:spore maturation protein A
MMNYVWSGMVLLSIVCAFINGKTADLTNAIIEAGNQAVGVFISLYGIMVLWGGLMRIASKAGVTAFIGRLMYPVLRLIFPNLKKDGEEYSFEAIDDDEEFNKVAEYIEELEDEIED